MSGPGFWERMGAAGLMLGGNGNHPQVDAVKQGLSWKEYEQLMRDAAYARQQADKLANMQSEQNLRKGELDINAKTTSNAVDASNFMAEAKGMMPGESRSRYEGLPLGTPNEGVQAQNVGEETSEQARASFQLAEFVRKNTLEDSQQKLEVRKHQLSDDNYKLSVEREKRLQIDSDSKNKMREAMGKWKLDNPAIDRGNELTREQAWSHAQRIIMGQLDFMDKTPSEINDAIGMLADEIQGKDARPDGEDDVIGEGSISDFSGFADDVNEPAAASEWAAKNQVHEEKKKVGEQLQRVEQELDGLKDSQTQAMSTAERALRPDIPLLQVIGMSPKAPMEALTADMKRLDQQAREYLAQGTPPEQWDDETYTFIQQLIEQSQKQSGGQ
jgi:hypothetical protein